MGEVHRAEGTTWKRQVALTVLPPDPVASPKRLERFRCKAEILAALDHPNIVTTHSMTKRDSGAEHLDGGRVVHFLTMHLVEGDPLSRRIGPGGLPIDQILQIAIPLADGLAAARERDRAS